MTDKLKIQFRGDHQIKQMADDIAEAHGEYVKKDGEEVPNTSAGIRIGVNKSHRALRKDQRQQEQDDPDGILDRIRENDDLIRRRIEGSEDMIRRRLRDGDTRGQ